MTKLAAIEGQLVSIKKYGAPQLWLREHLNYSGDDCLIWPFYTDGSGYAQIWWENRLQMTSRVVCQHRHGLPPKPNLDAAHSCGKGHLGCVNPTHLSWKTRKDNMKDCLEHGTHNRGSNNGQCKLTETQIREIRSSKMTQRVLAEKYGTSQSNISLIVRRINWSHLK